MVQKNTTSRIQPITPERASPQLKPIYNEIQKKIGRVINIFQGLGNSPAALKGYLALDEAASQTSLSPKLREEISLAVSQANNCNYCLSAHSAIGKSVGLKENEILDARKAKAQDPKTDAILRFVKLAIEKRGNVSADEVQKLKTNGVTDAELAEIVLIISLTQFTNYFNLITDTEIDFPEAPRLS